MKKFRLINYALILFISSFIALSGCSSSSGGKRYAKSSLKCKTTVPQKDGTLLYVGCGSFGRRFW